MQLRRASSARPLLLVNRPREHRVRLGLARTTSTASGQVGVLARQLRRLILHNDHELARLRLIPQHLTSLSQQQVRQHRSRSPVGYLIEERNGFSRLVVDDSQVRQIDVARRVVGVQIDCVVERALGQTWLVESGVQDAELVQRPELLSIGLRTEGTLEIGDLVEVDGRLQPVDAGCMERTDEGVRRRVEVKAQGQVRKLRIALPLLTHRQKLDLVGALGRYVRRDGGTV